MGLRFRICNWICKDYLRNYLAIGVKIPLVNLLKRNSKKLDSFDIEKIKEMIECIDKIFEL